jgi:hypothetical protein
MTYWSGRRLKKFEFEELIRLCASFFYKRNLNCGDDFLSFGVRPSSGVNASKNLVGNLPTKSITKFFCVSYDVNYLSNKSRNLIINIGAGTHMGGLWLEKIIFRSDVWALGFEPRLVQNSFWASCKIHFDTNKIFDPRHLK